MQYREFHQAHLGVYLSSNAAERQQTYGKHLQARERLHQELPLARVLREETDVGSHVDPSHHDLKNCAALPVLAAVGEGRLPR